MKWNLTAERAHFPSPLELICQRERRKWAAAEEPRYGRRAPRHAALLQPAVGRGTASTGPAHGRLPPRSPPPKTFLFYSSQETAERQRDGEGYART